MGQCQKCTHAESSTNEIIFFSKDSPMTQRINQQILTLQSGTIVQNPEYSIDDYSFAAHAPNPNYAQRLDEEQQKSFKAPKLIQELFNKLGPFDVQDFTNSQMKLLPKSEDPYFINLLNASYLGQWKHGQPWSQGILFYSNGNVYEGFQKNGIPSGQGRRFLKDGTYYIGNFENGQFSGDGKLFKLNGFTYVGNWLNNLPEGEGSEKWPNQTTYTGQYRSGKKEGQGKFSWPTKKGVQNSCVENYVGLFKDDVFDGLGLYEWQDGRVFQGNWRAGKMDGQGIFKWTDGRTYIGEYFQDIKHGQGAFKWPDGKKWEGRWALGKMDGQGMVTMPNGKIQLGEWKDGKRLRWIKDKDNGDSRSAISNFSERFVLGIEHEKQLINQLSENMLNIPGQK